MFTETRLKLERHQKILLITDVLYLLRSNLAFQRFGYSPILPIRDLALSWRAGRKAQKMRQEVFGFSRVETELLCVQWRSGHKKLNHE